MTSNAIALKRMTDGARKRDALARLLERYGEAQEFGSVGEPYGDLEWVLGAHRDPEREAADLDSNMIELIALWLQDLITDVERRPMLSAGDPDEPETDHPSSSGQTRQSAARNLRVAAESFVVAFRAIPVSK